MYKYIYIYIYILHIHTHIILYHTLHRHRAKSLRPRDPGRGIAAVLRPHRQDDAEGIIIHSNHGYYYYHQ